MSGIFFGEDCDDTKPEILGTDTFTKHTDGKCYKNYKIEGISIKHQNYSGRTVTIENGSVKDSHGSSILYVIDDDTTVDVSAISSGLPNDNIDDQGNPDPSIANLSWHDGSQDNVVNRCFTDSSDTTYSVAGGLPTSEEKTESVALEIVPKRPEETLKDFEFDFNVLKAQIDQFIASHTGVNVTVDDAIDFIPMDLDINELKFKRKKVGYNELDLSSPFVQDVIFNEFDAEVDVEFGVSLSKFAKIIRKIGKKAKIDKIEKWMDDLAQYITVEGSLNPNLTIDDDSKRTKKSFEDDEAYVYEESKKDTHSYNIGGSLTASATTKLEDDDEVHDIDVTVAVGLSTSIDTDVTVNTDEFDDLTFDMTLAPTTFDNVELTFEVKGEPRFEKQIEDYITGPLNGYEVLGEIKIIDGYNIKL